MAHLWIKAQEKKTNLAEFLEWNEMLNSYDCCRLLF